jgi:methanol dehydrogenase (cytochrome c) subunit 2
MNTTTRITGVVVASAVALAFTAITAVAYDGTKCSEPGKCWEPKPGYPAVVKGSKYDPKHDPKELAKQGDSIKEMEARNAKRSANFIKSGKWVYDVSKL